MNKNDMNAPLGQTQEAATSVGETSAEPCETCPMQDDATGVTDDATGVTNSSDDATGLPCSAMPAPSPAPSRWKRWGLVVVDILLFIVLHVALVALLSTPLLLLWPAGQGSPSGSLAPLINELIMLVAGVLAVYIVLRIRHLPWSGVGLRLRGWWRDFGAGIALAAALYAVGFAICLATGAVTVGGAQLSLRGQATSLLLFLMVAVYEETVSRGFLLGRMIDGGVHRLWALLLSSLLFSSMHLMNPNFALLPFINIVLAGILLGASYIYTRNLALPIALHWGWNYLQGPVLGFEVSGTRLTDSLLSLQLTGSDLISGGAFGFEGSLTCTVLMLLAIAGVMAWKRREAQKFKDVVHAMSDASNDRGRRSPTLRIS